MKNNFVNYFIAITFDNGSEFSSAATLYDEDLKIGYVCVFTGLERPANENRNGIFRRFHSKGMEKALDARRTVWLPALPI